jgi:TRAP-type C4-dicarboxylate transport system permease small subunit
LIFDFGFNMWAGGDMKRVNALFSVVSGLLVCSLMVLLSAEILGRKVGHPVPGATEFAGFALVGIIFLGLSHCEEKGGHVRVEFLLTRLPHRLRQVTELFVYFLGFCVYALMAWQTAIDAISSWSVLETVPGVMDLPVYPAKTVIPFGCSMICVQIVINSVALMTHRKKETPIPTESG